MGIPYHKDRQITIFLILFTVLQVKALWSSGKHIGLSVLTICNFLLFAGVSNLIKAFAAVVTSSQLGFIAVISCRVQEACM